MDRKIEKLKEIIMWLSLWGGIGGLIVMSVGCVIAMFCGASRETVNYYSALTVGLGLGITIGATIIDINLNRICDKLKEEEDA